MPQDNAVAGLTFRIRHTMLPVKDLARSIDFYTRLLGMQVTRRRIDDKRKLAVGYVGYGDESVNHALELIQNSDPAAPATVKTGDGHVAIGVNDIYKLCAVLEKEGVRFRQAPKPNRPGEKNFTAFILDPDGHEIELTERHPG